MKSRNLILLVLFALLITPVLAVAPTSNFYLVPTDMKVYSMVPYDAMVYQDGTYTIAVNRTGGIINATLTSAHTDDVVIQAAIDANLQTVGGNILGRGNIIEIGSGNYWISNTIFLKGGVLLRGNSATGFTYGWTHPGAYYQGTNLIAVDNLNKNMIYSEGTNYDKEGLENIHFDGNRYNNTGNTYAVIETKNVWTTYFSDVGIDFAPADGIKVWGGASCKNYMNRVSVYNFGGTGISVVGTDSMISGSDAEYGIGSDGNGTGIGVELDYVFGGNVVNLYTENNYYSLIIRYSQAVDISGVYIYNNKADFSVIITDSSKNIHLSGLYMNAAQLGPSRVLFQSTSSGSQISNSQFNNNPVFMGGTRNSVIDSTFNSSGTVNWDGATVQGKIEGCDFSNSVNSSYTNNVSDGGIIAHYLVTTPTSCRPSGTVPNETVTTTTLGPSTATVSIKKNSDGSPGTQQTVYWECKV